MARDGDDRLQSITFLASLIDFSEPGEIGFFIDESQVAMIEDVMLGLGYLDQRQMAGAFQMLRSRDLVWSRLIRDYLLGQRESVTDLVSWNADATRMPFRMHSQYLRKFYLANELVHGQLVVGDSAVRLEDIDRPAFAVGTIKDHVTPWRSVFMLTRLLDTDVDFVLTSGGHNAGIVSEPGHKGRYFRHLAHRNGELHPDPDQWSRETACRAGSWWPIWSHWLKGRSSGQASAGARKVPVIGPAPGIYVLES